MKKILLILTTTLLCSTNVFAAEKASKILINLSKLIKWSIVLAPVQTIYETQKKRFAEKAHETPVDESLSSSDGALEYIKNEIASIGLDPSTIKIKVNNISNSPAAAIPSESTIIIAQTVIATLPKEPRKFYKINQENLPILRKLLNIEDDITDEIMLSVLQVLHPNGVIDSLEIYWEGFDQGQRKEFNEARFIIQHEAAHILHQDVASLSAIMKPHYTATASAIGLAVLIDKGLTIINPGRKLLQRTFTFAIDYALLQIARGVIINCMRSEFYNASKRNIEQRADDTACDDVEVLQGGIDFFQKANLCNRFYRAILKTTEPWWKHVYIDIFETQRFKDRSHPAPEARIRKLQARIDAIKAKETEASNAE